MKNSTPVIASSQFSNYFFSRLVIGFLLVLGFTLHLQAQNPRISIQGTLKSANGTSVSDGIYNVTFKLYRNEMGGTALWQETASVDVIGSIYSHYLGSVTPLDAADFDSTLYLGVVVGNFELTPRTELSYSPYAFSVAVAQTVVCSGAVGDVKYSILNPTQFAAENGACWVPMDGRALASTDRLRVVTGWTNVPNAGGLFFRAQDFGGPNVAPGVPSNNDPERDHTTAIASIQQDELKKHDHNTSMEGSHTHGIPYGKDNLDNSTLEGQWAPGDTYFPNYTNQSGEAGGHTHTISLTGGAETRPKNMNIWVYIRIN